MTTSHKEFKTIGQFIKGDKEVQSHLFEEMIGMTGTLLSQLKTALAHGTKEEKKKILLKFQLVRHLMQMHFEKVKSKLSQEEMGLLLEYIARSPVYREQIGKAKQELEAHKEDLSKFVKHKPKIKSIKTKSKWIRS